MIVVYISSHTWSKIMLDWMACFVGETKMLIVVIDHLPMASKISLKVHLMKGYNEYRRCFLIVSSPTTWVLDTVDSDFYLFI